MADKNELEIVSRETSKDRQLLFQENIGTERSLIAVKQFGDLVQKHFVKGSDYAKINGLDKPILLKPGAEKLLLILGIAPRYELVDKTEIWDEGKEFASYTFSCKLTVERNGEPYIIGEGYGSANTKEKNVGKAHIPDQFNTKLKIAKKRALIDAALMVSAVSHIFTQDLADDPEMVLGGEKAKLDKFTAMKVYSKTYKHFGLKTEAQQEKGKKWMNKKVQEYCFETQLPYKQLMPIQEGMTVEWYKGFIEWYEKELADHYYNTNNSKIFRNKEEK